MRSWVAAGAIGAVLVGAWMVPGGAFAAPPPPPPPDRVHLGAGSCAAQACHGGTKEGLNEHTIWIQKDEHSQAYLHLLGDLAKQIQRRLKTGTPAHEDATCIACHGTLEQTPLGDRFDKRDGVSCELCHGASSGWLGAHAAPGWKEKKTSEKVALGMRDLSTPRQRVQACMGCHVGAPGKEVNHDLIAAGHPALVFDAAVFTDEMPPHWRDEEDLRSTTWAAGKFAQVNAYASLVASAAERDGSRLDYALFDCGACHHALGGNNPYTRHDPPGRAGSLPLDWSSWEVLTNLAAQEDLRALGQQLPRAQDPRGEALDPVRLRRFWKAAEPFAAEPIRLLFPKQMDGALARIERDEVRAPRRLLQQYAFATRALSNDTAEFREAYAALEEALAERLYDPQRCAKLARAAFAAGR